MATAEKKEKDKEEKEIEIPDELPILPVRDIVVFPYMILPLFVGREKSINAIDHCLGVNRMIMLLAQRDMNVEDPGPADLYTIGTVGLIMRMLKLPDGRVKVLVQGLTKARCMKIDDKESFFAAHIEKIEDPKPQDLTLETEALIRNVKDQIDKMVALGKTILPDIMVVMENLEEPGRLADLVASNIGLKTEQAQSVLEIDNTTERLRRVSEILNRELELLMVQQKIQSEARGEIDKTQREYFLREQLKAIQKELGDIDERMEEVKEFRKKIEEAKMPEKVLKEAEKQLKRIEKMHPDSAEASTVRTYLDWLVELPWSKSTKDNLNIKVAKKVLNTDHYDLEKIKERILEYLSVRKLNPRMKGPILCFIGPPGVGKTSLGKSIARALGREFTRMSLGGVRDEAEIRGHRRTYVGALPGRIIQGIKHAGTNNPVFMLDEIDKVGTDFRGDPSSALLEVLDPEQNNTFMDHYLGVPFDLTSVMFITTGNVSDTIPSALRDRMEIIRLSGYTSEEKHGIAVNYLLPKQLKEHGLTVRILRISDSALESLIGQYTREAGVRNLEREIANLCRKVAKQIAEGRKKKFLISSKNISKYLGAPRYLPEEEMKKDEVGVATGLAWTETGGDIIFIEAITMKGKGSLTLTGQLGDVMKESAQAALSYVRSRAKELGIAEDIFSKKDIHIHVPAGAIPKDGPSAGITLTTAIASALTGIPVSKSIAMTGEVTLRGNVLPIGGLKEKALAAKRFGVQKVIVPRRNEKDLEDIPKYVKKDMEFFFADTMDQVLEVALKKKIHVSGKADTGKAGTGDTENAVKSGAADAGGKTVKSKPVKSKTVKNMILKDKTGQSKSAPDKSAPDKSAQNKSAQNKTAKTKTAQNKTAKDKTAKTGTVERGTGKRAKKPSAPG
jgi:ATP-dependent Lon protease